MCGIACTARLDGRDLAPDTDVLLNALADILQHRGPDERELLRDGPVGMAFTRLSLVDPADGSQPLTSDDGSLVLIANGEVYNHKQLAAGLPAGVRMRTGSDCEVLLHLYRQHGLDFLRDVRGMFAVILWDRANGQLILARDRFGIKPLYYHRNAERIVLSSEIKGLFADPSTPRRFDWESALSVPLLAASTGFNETPLCTWFEGVESVPAATILRIDLRDGRTTRHRYWDLPVEAEESTSAESFIERYGDLLEDSVRDCATADTELGLFLSGGIDSSAVLALAAPRLEGLHTFTALTGGTRDNGDAESSQWIARELGVHNHQVVFDRDHTPTPQEWLRLLWLTENPMCGPEVYYKHELHRFARVERPELRGMLLGAASDEFNGGYSELLGGSDWDSFMGSLRYMDRSTRLADRPALGRWWADGESFISERALAAGGTDDRSDPYRKYVASEYLKVQQYNVWHEDRTAAGSGIEARVPFLDHRLIELTAAIPDRLRPRLLWDKRILREAVAARIPTRIAERPKVPFFYGSGTGHAYRMLVRLMRSNDHELVQRALAAPGADTYLDADAVLRRLTELENGESPAVEILMRVVNMGLLSSMADRIPTLEKLSAGPIGRALPQESHPVTDTEDLFATPRDYVTDRIPVPAEGVLLLTDPDASSWFLLNDGQIEYVLDKDTPILRVLRQIDGKTALGDVLNTADVSLDEVRGELDELFDGRLYAFGE
jgi:asparagine synthase (glutamine-hydrolysing)